MRVGRHKHSVGPLDSAAANGYRPTYRSLAAPATAPTLVRETIDTWIQTQRGQVL